MRPADKRYDRPKVSDYGSLAQVTAATGFSGNEDGGAKQAVHHTGPFRP